MADTTGGGSGLSPILLGAEQEVSKAVYALLIEMGTTSAAILAQLVLLTAAVTASGPVYTTGTWTPVLTWATAGDQSIAYTTQVASYSKIGNIVRASYNIVTSTFTHTTSSGNLEITGLPVASANVASNVSIGSLSWGGITKASYTNVVAKIDPNTSLIYFVASGSAQAESNIVAADAPTAGTVSLQGTIIYQSA